MRANRVEISFSASHEGFAQAFAELRAALDEQGLTEAARYNAELVFEEIVSNIVNYGAADGHVPDVRVVLEPQTDAIVLTFEDNGVPFDPRGKPDPLPAKSLEEAKIGGFGLMLVRRASSSLDYRRTAEGHNELTVAVRRLTRH